MAKSVVGIYRKIAPFILLLGIVSTCLFLVSTPVKAAAGINQTMNFQGRLLNSQGATVPDGYYNIEFKIYQDGNGCVSSGTAPCGGTRMWTEDYLNANSQGITVRNGYLSVQLGSICPFSGGSCQGNSNTAVNWNQDTLWLSMDIAGTGASCTPYSTCNPDGEMVPFKRLSSSPYALNSGQLGGLASSQFLQIGQGVQTDAANVTSLYVNKTGTGNIIDLQSAGNDAFIINNTGDVNFGGSGNHNIAVVAAAAGLAGKSLTLSAGGAGTGGSALAGGNLVLQGGAGGGTNGNGGNITIDAGVKNGSGTDGTISIGTTTASSITIGKSGTGTTVAGALTVNSGVTVGSAAGNGSLTNNGSTINTTLSISDLASGGNIGTAATTVDVYTSFSVNQSTSGQTITLPNPTSSTAGRIIYVSNVGSTSFTLLGSKLSTGNTAAVMWNGTAWSLAGAPIDAILNQNASAQTANFYIRSAANNKVASVIEGANGQTADLIDINTYNGTSSTTATSFDSKGYLHFNNAAAASDAVVMARVSGDTNDRYIVSADGTLSWGPGNAATDTTLYRNGVASLRTNGSLQTDGNLTVAGTGASSVAGTLSIGSATAPSSGVAYINGSVGIGTSSPGYLLDVRGSTTSQLHLTSGNNDADTYLLGSGGVSVLSSNGAFNGTNWLAKAVNSAQLVLSSTTLVFKSDSGLTVGNTYTPTIRFTVGASGAVTLAGGQTSDLTTANSASGTANNITMQPGSSGLSSGTGASLSLSAGNQTGTTSTGGSVSINGGSGTSTNGGVNIGTGSNTGAVTLGRSGITVNIQGNTQVALSGTTGTTMVCQNGSSVISSCDATFITPTASHFIQNGSTVQTNANIYTRSAATNKVAAVIEGASGQAVDLVDINTYDGSSSSTVTSFDTKGYLHFNKAASVSDAVIMARVNADTNDRFTVGADGKLSWGPGNASTDVTLSRSGSGQLAIGGGLTIGNVSSTTALQVLNGSGNRVLGVDTSSNQVLLGQANQTNGTLVFKNSTNSNTVTLNSTAATASYTLTLPSAAPAAGLCLETSSGNAGQLVFASCANNNSNISEVQELDANNTNTITITPSAVGDEVVVTTQIPTGGVTVTGITGGGVSNWSKIVANAGNGTVNRVEMWAGTVTSTSTSAITVTYSSAPGTEEITASEFTASGVNSSTSWGIESYQSQLNSTSSGTVTFPSLTAVNGSEMYIGYAQVQNPPATAGSNSNFSYIVTGTQHNVLTYDPALAANTTYQPTANQSSAGQSNSVAAILTAFVTSTSINNTTSLQKANFYVQAASGGSVAGVLQAASSGTADILNVRNSGAANVVTVGYNGITTFKNSANSSAAFQVQNQNGNNVLSVNTTAGSVVLGTSSALSGALTFNDAGDNNTITLAAPSTVAASYTLSLPTNTPTAGLCLGTSPSNANQLIFASCATQVSAASISYVNKWSNSGTAVTTVADSPASKGNLLVFYSWANNNVSVSSVSGGGVTNWTKVTSYTGGGASGNVEMWRGVVTTTGAGTITVTYSAGAGTNEITAQEFSMGSSNGTWAVDTSGTSTSATNVTTVNYPSLTPLNSSELYAGYAYGKGTMTAGSTTGFTYLATSASKYLAYDTTTSAGVAVAPTATQTSQPYAAVAAAIAAYAGTSVIVNSTATQQANFNVQAATSGTVAGILQAASSGTADIFQAQDASGNNVVSVNASSGLTLGTSSLVNGTIKFASSTSSNTITLSAPSSIGTSYSLTLPGGQPAPAQCLSTSASDATKLVFSSCANQVTSVGITYVNSWSNTGNSVSTVSVSPANIGDLMILFSNPNNKGTITSISGGGVSAWTKVNATTAGGGANTSAVEMWRGVVTSTGASTITITGSGQGNPNELAVSEFTMGSATGSWVVDSSDVITNPGSSTTVNYPSLTPQGTKDLYIGYAAGQQTMSAGSTSGYSYVATGLGHYEAYNTTISATSQPSATQSPAGNYISIGALIAAYSSSSVIANSTFTQQANMNIQSASSGDVAAVFQAASTGTADIVDMLDSAGTVVDSFSSTGNLLVKPSTASSAAFQVQTTGSVNVLSVDTNALKVKIGAGSAGEATPSLLVLDNETGSSNDPTELNGAMYYNATTHTFRCGVDGNWQSCTGLLYANSSSSSAVSNCTNNCLAFSTNASIPANYCQTGRLIKLLASGYFSSASGTNNLQFGLYYGTDNSTASNDTLIGTLSPAETVSSATNNYFQINYNIICFSTSSMQGGGTLSIQTGTASSGMAVVPMAGTGSTTVTSNAAKNLYIFPVWDNASTSNTATVNQFAVTAN